MTDVALVTCAALPGLYPDDRALLPALEDVGISAEPVVWEDRLYPWRSVGLCMVRSVWDYAFRREAFLAWAARTARMTTVWNPPELVEWNTHKAYLVDLESRGVPVVPTVVLRRGRHVDLRTEMRDRGWPSVVLKAAVAQTGRYALKVGADDVDRGQAHLDRILPHEDMLLQPFLPTIAEGELSVTVVDGAVTHAVHKRAAPGDFRVHVDFGGAEERREPSSDEAAVVEAALGALPVRTLYGRVDLVVGLDGRPAVMELEVVEPDLFFRHAPEAARRLAEAVRNELGRRG
jgi:glutathione synthase/RimK-type ligase-like ATP-grasp enzyme